MALLNKDGLISSAEIARQLGDVSARTVTNRINALIEQGIINRKRIPLAAKHQRNFHLAAIICTR